MFVQNVFTFLLKFCKCISIEYRLHESLTKLRSLGHGFFNSTASKLLNDLHDAELDKRQRKTFQRLDNLPDCPSKTRSWKLRKKL